ncbi:signal peptidase II [Phaeodactylibacter xiamenensis]|jgi:signal peptidase II|uniref:signal peptidase II n=1 Tax=Phaeodactylibacter xiamenensis TaxID=1524460 RepID=UPI0024A7E3AC|nr:signal peptidase II [Phaeodactylibacter xiamenensis]
MMNFTVDGKRIALVLGVVIANIVLDQVTKSMAREQLMGAGQISYLGDFFRLSFVENRGAFLSLGADMSEQLRYWGLKVLPVLLLIGLLGYTLFSPNLSKLQILAFAFILGGGISNVYDRLLYNQVVDFMNMGFPNLRTGIFNFADVSIMVGLGLMLPELFRRPSEK